MSTSEKEATMIYIKIDNDLFYDDAVVLVRSFYPRTEVTALKADSKPEDDDEIITIEVPDITGLDKKVQPKNRLRSILWKSIMRVRKKQTLPLQ